MKKATIQMRQDIVFIANLINCNSNCIFSKEMDVVY